MNTIQKVWLLLLLVDAWIYALAALLLLYEHVKILENIVNITLWLLVALLLMWVFATLLFKYYAEKRSDKLQGEIKILKDEEGARVVLIPKFSGWKRIFEILMTEDMQVILLYIDANITKWIEIDKIKHILSEVNEK